MITSHVFNVAVVGVAIVSWAIIFFMIATFLQHCKNKLSDHNRKNFADKQDCWGDNLWYLSMK